MKKFLSVLLSVLLVAAVFAVPVAAEDTKVIGFDRVNNYDWTNKDFQSDAYTPTAASAGEVLLAVSKESKTVADLIGGNWFGWWYKVKAELSDGAYVITEIDAPGSTAYEAWTAKDGQIIFMCNTGYASTEPAGNVADADVIKTLVVGDKLYLNGNFDELCAASGAITDVYVSVNAPLSSDDEEDEEVPSVPVLLSEGKSYTTTTPNRGDSFDDDGKKLTNGVKGQADAGTAESAGWNDPDKTDDIANVVEIIVDLGETVKSDSYVVYLAGGNWGIGVPTYNAEKDEHGTSLEVYVSDSADADFELVASAADTDVVLVGGTGAVDNSWSTFTLTANADELVEGRYVKFVISAAPVGNAFIWMDEVEVYGKTVAADGGEEDKEPEVIVEEIAVDGDLNDTGWAKDKWIEVDADNGYWQTVPTTDTISYKYQLRADETKLYAAFVVDCAAVEGGNGNGTNIRFWLNTNEEATIYTHFYDVFVGGTGAKYNTSTTENKGAAIENSTINAVMTTKDGKTYVEFSVDLAEFGGEEGFNYFICVSNKVNENVCLYYPAVALGEDDSRTANLPYGKWYADGQAEVTVSEIVLGEVIVDNGDDKEEEKVPGDMSNMIVFALLAVVAIAGSAVVIKTRR